jgi:hypothetical protein
MFRQSSTDAITHVWPLDLLVDDEAGCRKLATVGNDSKPDGLTPETISRARSFLTRRK